MTLQEYNEALSCKLAGTWNLHKAAAEEQQPSNRLDFFTMLSSISGVVGTAGQANYAAGNSFQDAMARYRQSLGLAAHTVDLGIVDDVGYMSEHEALTTRVQSRSQLSSITEAQLLDILRLSILQQTKRMNPESSSQMVTGLPYPINEDSPILADARFHQLLAPRQDADDAAASPNDKNGAALSAFKSMLKAGSFSVEKLAAEAVKLVNAQIVRILGLVADIEESKPLSSYGIDSLAAVDLRNWCKKSLEVDMTTLDVLNASSLGALCMKLVKKAVEGQGA